MKYPCRDRSDLRRFPVPLSSESCRSILHPWFFFRDYSSFLTCHRSLKLRCPRFHGFRVLDECPVLFTILYPPVLWSYSPSRDVDCPTLWNQFRERRDPEPTELTLYFCSQIQSLKSTTQGISGSKVPLGNPQCRPHSSFTSPKIEEVCLVTVLQGI